MPKGIKNKNSPSLRKKMFARFKLILDKKTK